MVELPKNYDPASVEQKWYARWLERGDFRADAHSPKPPFSIVMPPPNITGVLTLGHVLNNTIQDVLARRARMSGHEVLWLPGVDHAGVATQTAVERHLWRTEKKTRHHLGREEFLRRVLEWQDKHGGIIIEQLKRLGASADWSRQRYTLDDAYVRAVQQVFVDLYNEGLIYRGRRMINWDPAAMTALSDEEVIPTPQKSTLYYVRYEIVEESGASTSLANSQTQARGSRHFLEVATTRPETIMADTAVAVHPSDKRYRDLIGQHAWRPLARKSIPIIADEAIDPEFGTGVLKVTPAHDKADFEIGERHNLSVIDVLHPDGRINCPAVPELDGLDRFEARIKAADLLKKGGLLTKEVPYENNIGFSERAGIPIEPRISEQWFLRYPKTKEALQAVREHLIRFFPQHWEKVYGQWIENIQDWCISRQVWWGHRIPAWYKVGQVSNLPSETQAQVGNLSHFVGFDQFSNVEVTSRRSPHWQQEGATYFVTFRLADSLPPEKLADLEAERARWIDAHPEPWSESDKRGYYERFSKRIEEWLDAGYGSCVLREPNAAKIVGSALKYFDGDRYALLSWVVMPNHVHVLLRPIGDHRLGDIFHSWKLYTSRRINELLGREGQLWQHESYDHIVRDAAALYRIGRYIEQNPTKAGIQVTQLGKLQSEESQVGNLRHIEVRVQVDSPGKGWSQDPDTLDTWFSAWLWAYETMDSETRKKFYPTSVLVTAPDIIFFWVARMIMAGLHFKPGQSDRLEDNVAFRDVFFTGLIRDKQGRKMSKSLGNSPDPLELISKYGADGLRFGLMRIAPSGQDIRFDEKQIEEGRNFATKLWNAARFRQMHGPSAAEPKVENQLLSIYSIEVLARLNETIDQINEAYGEYRFNEVAQRLYDFFWSDYCDWFVEAAKTEIFGSDQARKQFALAVMDFVLSAVLRLLHPLMPYITEELWSLLAFGKDSIQFAAPPKAFALDTPELANKRSLVSAIYGTVQAGRNLRAESKIPSNKKVRFILRTPNESFGVELPTMARLLNAEDVTLERNYKAEPGVPVAATALGELFLLISGADKGAERDRLEKEMVKLENELRTVNNKLSKSAFVEKAPAEVVEEHQRRKADFTERLAQLRRAREALD